MPGRAPPAAPRAALFLAAALAALRTRPAQGEEDTELSGDMLPGTGGLDAESEALSTTAAATTETSITSINATLIEEDSDQLEFILIVLIPVILLSLLLLSAIFLVIYHKRKRNKQEPSSQGSQSVLQTHELGSESVKVPIFEEDTPSVMEIEMEELDKWMNSMNRNADYECLPTLEEEKEPNHSNPRCLVRKTDGGDNLNRITEQDDNES
ncbi:transmembrane protein 154 isoform X2 [Moschus berezovskii]|uniref:transmembrane protein 154 isoform X2 n=1 Tax=Moschus berezovskii TaxID=68408 RepID=UPI0024439346|nr:transmembrane protein 154 isoform X2 [Moschus berezovskii]